MNRQDRREAMGRGCVAPYRLDGRPVHAPEDCDGSCRAGMVVVEGAFGMAVAALVAGIPSETVARLLVLVLRQETAAARSEALAALVRVRALAWLYRRCGIKSTPRRRRASMGPRAAAVRCCPPTGPPAGRMSGSFFVREVAVT
jgi:hypothetical protein